ncbi:Hypothetical protein D9617_3g022820 [Elsinoe fawcettii]|nr:Hypothetical protein D9617_3g022820 [Elsinoe fawcettii]
MVANFWNAPSPVFCETLTDINGPFNNFSQMGNGLIRVDVTPDGECHIGWELAKQGIWVYDLTARDYETGEIRWNVRVGAEGSFNSNFQVPVLGPDGAVYMFTLHGIIRVFDS